MKRFRFPLRPVAVIRAHKEMRAREAFAASVHSYVQTEERLATTRARVKELEQLLFAGRSERFAPPMPPGFSVFTVLSAKRKLTANER